MIKAVVIDDGVARADRVTYESTASRPGVAPGETACRDSAEPERIIADGS